MINGMPFKTSVHYEHLMSRMSEEDRRIFLISGERNRTSGFPRDEVFWRLNIAENRTSGGGYASNFNGVPSGGGCRYECQ